MNSDSPLAILDPRFRLVSGRTKPDFMLVGGAKCGSTSFSRYIAAHPQVTINGPKEPNFWSWHRYPRRYQDFFVNEEPINNPSPEAPISGEFSTSSLLHPLVPRRVLANLPSIRIFILLRNPIDRTYSHYQMAKNAGQEKECAFDDIVANEIDEVPTLLKAHMDGFDHSSGDPKRCFSDENGKPLRVAKHIHGFPERTLLTEMDLRSFYVQSFVFRSIYCDQVERWLRLFSRDQIMFLQSEEFFSDPSLTMDRVAKFLGLQKFDFGSSGPLQRAWDLGAQDVFETPREYPDMNEETRLMLAEFFKPYNERLYQLIGHDLDWD